MSLTEPAELAPPPRRENARMTARRRTTATPTPDLLTQRLVRLLRLLDGQVGQVLAENGGLRLLEWRILAELATRPEATVRAIAGALSISRSEVSRGAGALVEAGYVERRDDPEDARSALFLATDAGRRLYDRIYPLRQAAMHALMSTVPAEDAKAFDRTLQALTATLENDLDRPGRLRTRAGRRRPAP